MLIKRITAFLLVLSIGGCVSTEQVSFKAGVGQTAMQRDGRPAVSSIGKNSIALLSRVGRELPQGQRVGYVLALQSRGQTPLDFQVSSIDVVQSFPDRPSQPIEVLTFAKLQREEQTRQIIGALLVGVAAGANAAAASRAGYYNARSTVYTPRGTYSVATTGYSPIAAAIAQGNANAQNAAMVDAAVAQGQANMARLEHEYIKDHTLLPGEWYGGLVGIEPPAYSSADDVKTYTMTIRVGPDTHTFNVVQSPVKR
jgi:hypothetical protein